MPTEVARVVALGPSNLTCGLQPIVSIARTAWGADVELLAALGLGRSYGACSRALVRTLPGILESGLWKKLESLTAVPTLDLVTDVGNDILYGSSAEWILAWVEEAVRRLPLFEHHGSPAVLDFRIRALVDRDGPILWHRLVSPDSSTFSMLGWGAFSVCYTGLT
jgi:hypothetical protein